MEFNRSHRVYDFMAIRKYWIAFSVTLTVISTILLFKPGPKYGIDFMGGTELTVQFESAVDTGRIRDTLERLGHHHPEVVPSTSRPNEFIIRVERASSVSAAQANSIQTQLQALLARDSANGTLGFFRVSPGGDHIVVQLASSTIDGRRVAALVREAGANVRGNEALQAGAADIDLTTQRRRGFIVRTDVEFDQSDRFGARCQCKRDAGNGCRFSGRDGTQGALDEVAAFSVADETQRAGIRRRGDLQ